MDELTDIVAKYEETAAELRRPPRMLAFGSPLLLAVGFMLLAAAIEPIASNHVPETGAFILGFVGIAVLYFWKLADGWEETRREVDQTLLTLLVVSMVRDEIAGVASSQDVVKAIRAAKAKRSKKR